MAHVLYSSKIFTGETFLENVLMEIERDRIKSITPNIAPTKDATIMQAAYVVPGFIDIQVNGGGGVLFNAQPTSDGLKKIAKAHLQFGTTAFLPTVISDDLQVMQQAAEAVQNAFEEKIPGILGIHWEGPFLNPEKHGIHPRGNVRMPTSEDIDFFEKMAPIGRGVKMLTLAPEQVNIDFLKRLQSAGFILSAGHTQATYAQMQTAIGAGVRGITHFFNACSPLTSREPGVVGAGLESDQIWCSIIADGFHIHEATLQIAWRAKKNRRQWMLITDAMPPVGDPSHPISFSLLNSEKIFVKEGCCVNADGILAGSVLDMASALRYVVKRLKWPLEDAFRMSSTNVADFLKLVDYGRLQVDAHADLVLLDEKLQVMRVMQGGQWQ